MDDPLVDEEGFPRSDIDVYQVRHARSNIRSKGNDLISIVARIETGLHSLHAQARETCQDGRVVNNQKELPSIRQPGDQVQDQGAWTELDREVEHRQQPQHHR